VQIGIFKPAEPHSPWNASANSISITVGTAVVAAAGGRAAKFGGIRISFLGKITISFFFWASAFLTWKISEFYCSIDSETTRKFVGDNFCCPASVSV